MKISKTDRGQKALQSLERRLRVSNRREQTIRNYVRCLKTLVEYHQQLPDEVNIDSFQNKVLNHIKLSLNGAILTVKETKRKKT